MSTFTFLVTVDTERSAGLHASRDDQSEIIAGELESAIENVSLTGLGARSDSEYEVVESSVQELDSKQLRATNAEHEERVREELPGDADLRRELKTKTAELRDALQKIKTLEHDAERAAADREAGATRIWQSDFGGAAHETRHYIADDAIYFGIGERENVRVKHSGERELEVMVNGWGELTMKPQSGNVILIRVGDK